jgi:hypothetical protein
MVVQVVEIVVVAAIVIVGVEVVVVAVEAVVVVAVVVQQFDPGRAKALRANRGVKIAGLANEGDRRQGVNQKS